MCFLKLYKNGTLSYNKSAIILIIGGKYTMLRNLNVYDKNDRKLLL